MKKLAALLLILLALAGCAAFAEAAPRSAEVYVSISDDTGSLVLAYVPVTVTDLDADGLLTIHDALAVAHAAHHPDGTEGYLAEASEFGLSMVRLWGVENGGSYGYYRNNASVWSLLDEVADGDHVKAYAFTDLAGWSDAYAFFSSEFACIPCGTALTLTLQREAFDANWNPVHLPVEGAELFLDGMPTGVLTDAEGQASLLIAAPGVYVLTARSQALNLVPPVCVVTVEAAE